MTLRIEAVRRKLYIFANKMHKRIPENCTMGLTTTILSLKNVKDFKNRSAREIINSCQLVWRQMKANCHGCDVFCILHLDLIDE